MELLKALDALRQVDANEFFVTRSFIVLDHKCRIWKPFFDVIVVAILTYACRLLVCRGKRRAVFGYIICHGGCDNRKKQQSLTTINNNSWHPHIPGKGSNRHLTNHASAATCVSDCTERDIGRTQISRGDLHPADAKSPSRIRTFDAKPAAADGLVTAGRLPLEPPHRAARIAVGANACAWSAGQFCF